MHIEVTGITELCGVLTVFLTAVVNPLLGEWRVSRSRRFMVEQSAVTNRKLDDVGIDAKAAYHEANGVNVWRQTLTESLHQKQDDTREAVEQVKAVATETNLKVELAITRPRPSPLIILTTASEEEAP